MGDADERLRAVVSDYSNFLRDMELALPKHQPYIVRWVREFLLFARQHGGCTFEHTLDLFLAEVGRRVGVKPWQIQQAADAVRIYRYQFRGAEHHETNAATSRPMSPDDRSLVERLREVIRLWHYARRRGPLSGRQARFHQGALSRP